MFSSHKEFIFGRTWRWEGPWSWGKVLGLLVVKHGLCFPAGQQELILELWNCFTASQPPDGTLLAVISPVSMIWNKWVWCSAQCPCHGSPGGPHLQSSDPDAMVHLQTILPKSRQRKCFMCELRYAKYDHLVFYELDFFMSPHPDLSGSCVFLVNQGFPTSPALHQSFDI